MNGGCGRAGQRTMAQAGGGTSKGPKTVGQREVDYFDSKKRSEPLETRTLNAFRDWAVRQLVGGRRPWKPPG